MSYDVNDIEYQQVCDLLDKFADIGCINVLCDIIRSLCFNYDEAKDYVLNYYGEELEI